MAVDAVGDLHVECSDGASARVVGLGSVIDVRVGSLSGLLSWWRSARPVALRADGAALKRALDVAGVSIRVLVAEAEVARLQAGYDGTVLARLLGIAPFRLSLTGLFRSIRGPWRG